MMVHTALDCSTQTLELGFHVPHAYLGTNAPPRLATAAHTCNPYVPSSRDCFVSAVLPVKSPPWTRLWPSELHPHNSRGLLFLLDEWMKWGRLKSLPPSVVAGFAIGLDRRAPPLWGDGGGTRRKAELGDLAWTGLGTTRLGVSTAAQWRD
jgi:hypothetical protein